jgi:4-hydroxybenzoate polyprenyltransferase
LKLVKTFIHSNIFLSIAAVLLTVSAQVQLGMQPQWQPYLLLIFFATLFEYNRHRLVALITCNKEALNSEKNRWVRENQKKFYFLVFVSVAGFLAAVFSTKTEVLLTFLPLAILTFLYLVPGSENKNYFFKLREVPYLKIFLIAFVWSASTIILPVIQAGEEIFNRQVLLLFSERFFFIFAIAIPFDIRDMKADRDAGLKTIPILIDQNKALVLSYLSLLLCFLISFFHYQMQNEWFVIEALCISLITTYLFLKLQFFRNLNRYYYQILDGTLILQGVLVLAFYFINHA